MNHFTNDKIFVYGRDSLGIRHPVKKNLCDIVGTYGLQ